MVSENSGCTDVCKSVALLLTVRPWALHMRISVRRITKCSHYPRRALSSSGIPLIAQTVLSTKHSINIDVGGKVFHIPIQSAIIYPRTLIGSWALCRDQAKLLTSCDDNDVCKNEFCSDHDPAFSTTSPICTIVGCCGSSGKCAPSTLRENTGA